MIGVMAPKSFAQGAPAPKNDTNLNQEGPVKTIFNFKDDIGLTDDQEVKLKALLYDEQSFMDAQNTTLKALGIELSKMIEQKDDMQAIKNKLEDIAKIQVDVSYRNILDSRSSETILTPDQLAKWRDIQKKFSAQGRS
jgi:Spy/CpxP family protein refolding chaperone